MSVKLIKVLNSSGNVGEPIKFKKASGTTIAAGSFCTLTTGGEVSLASGQKKPELFSACAAGANDEFVYALRVNSDMLFEGGISNPAGYSVGDKVGVGTDGSLAAGESGYQYFTIIAINDGMLTVAISEV